MERPVCILRSLGVTGDQLFLTAWSPPTGDWMGSTFASPISDGEHIFFRTRQGTTYNAFLVMADKITLIDTVKPPFLPELLARISSVRLRPTVPQVPPAVSGGPRIDGGSIPPES